MSATVGPPTSQNDASSGRREELASQLDRLGVEPGIVDKVLPNASVDELTLIDALVAQIAKTRRTADARAEESMPLDEYRDVLERLGDEYLGPLTATAISSAADVRPEQLREGVEVLSEMARMLRAIPSSRRIALWPAINGEMTSALPHYRNLKRAIVETGIAAALDAEDHVVMTHLRREAVPSLDLAVLRMAGESDPERALLGLIRAARSAGRTKLAMKTVTQLLEESERYLQPQAFGVPVPVPAPGSGLAPKPKRWTGWGKIFTGMATAGANIAGGIALGIGGGPLAAGVTAGGVLASCAGGIGAIAEGVGALQGE